MFGDYCKPCLQTELLDLGLDADEKNSIAAYAKLSCSCTQCFDRVLLSARSWELAEKVRESKCSKNDVLRYCFQSELIRKDFEEPTLAPPAVPPKRAEESQEEESEDPVAQRFELEDPVYAQEKIANKARENAKKKARQGLLEKTAEEAQKRAEKEYNVRGVQDEKATEVPRGRPK